MGAGSPRLLILTPDFPPEYGGIQRLSHRLACHLRSFRTLVLTLEAGSHDPPAAVWPFGLHRVSARGGHRVAVARLNLRAGLIAARSRPDVVLSMHIVTSPAAAAIGRAFGVPWAQYLHADELAARPALASAAVRTADASIAVSRYTRTLALRAGAHPDRVRVIPPGVELPASSAIQRSRQPTVITVSRLAEAYKGHDVMIRALPMILARVPQARWIVIGDGPLLGSLRRLADAAGLDGNAIGFMGALSDTERDRWLGQAHVFAMPSRVPGGASAGEGFGMVFVEAGAHGLPVVAGREGGAVDAVVDGHTGLLVDPRDHTAVADAVVELLIDPQRASTLGASGRARAQDFSWPKIAAHVEQVLHTVRRDR